MTKRTKYLTLAAVIGALYAALTLLSAVFGLAVGPFEFRISEALTILPVLTPAAVPGLFVGCLGANLLCGAALPDVIFGSLATLLGALGSYCTRKHPVLPYLCPIVSNAVVIPPILYHVYGFQESGFLLLFFSFVVGQSVSVGLFGYWFRRALAPIEKHLK